MARKQPTANGIPEKKSSLRRRSLHIVIVLLVFYPIGVYMIPEHQCT